MRTIVDQAPVTVSAVDSGGKQRRMRRSRLIVTPDLAVAVANGKQIWRFTAVDKPDQQRSTWKLTTTSGDTLTWSTCGCSVPAHLRKLNPEVLFADG